VDYLHTVEFKDAAAEAVAAFSLRQVGWFMLFFLLSAGLVAAIFSGVFGGSSARWGAVLLGVLLVADLGRANLPWVIIWNYAEKYASNPVIDRLRDKPYEHRITVVPLRLPPGLPALSKLYRNEWLAQQFPYYNLQTLDIVDMPRKPVDYKAYMDNLALATNAPDDQEPTGSLSFIRLWQLTGTDYLLGLADCQDTLNGWTRKEGLSFRILQRFDIVPKPGVTNPTDWQSLTVAPGDNGAFALFKFTGALPRAKLFANWQTVADDAAVLKELISPDFDPARSVLVSGGLPPIAANAAGLPNDGTVDYISYTPKTIVLKCDAPSSTVLLLNDHYDPVWNVRVDGRPETVLRCNYLMRGVWLPPGAHTVEFRYQTSFRLLYVTLSAMGAALLLLTGVLIASRRPVRSVQP
jgi:hypothetical protein